MVRRPALTGGVPLWPAGMKAVFPDLTECVQNIAPGESAARRETRQTDLRAEGIRMFSAVTRMEVYEDNLEKMPRTEVVVQVALDRVIHLYVLESPYLIFGWPERDAQGEPPA